MRAPLHLIAAIALLAGGVQAQRAETVAARTAPAADQTAPIDDLVRRGRERIEAGRPDEAMALLEEADRKAGGAPATRVWLIRCWIARGYVNDALDAADELAAEGLEGPPLDYLYGMALHARAKEYMAQAVGGGMIEMNFRDAARFLSAATEADPAEYRDAFLPLAEAAWHGQDLGTSRAAAERALALRPDGFDEAVMLGRVAFSQYAAASGDGGRPVEADAHWQTAHDAFQAGIEAAAFPEDPALRSTLADCHVQLAYTFVWKEHTEDASQQFSEAMAWDPSVVDYRSLWTYFEPLGVLRCLERGERGFQDLHPSAANGDALLLWWLGWANLSQKFYPEAEQAFARALAKEPAYVDSRFYMGLARYHQQDFDGAVEAITAGCLVDLDKMLTAAATDPATTTPILAWLVDRCATATPPHNLEAAILAELRARVADDDALFWSYAGLFYRDAADALRTTSAEGSAGRRAALYEKALAAYERALELEPEHPNYLNDTAVVLHYCLGRDLDRARQLYRRAAERAAAELAREELPEDLRALYSIALRDSRDNLRRLDER